MTNIYLFKVKRLLLFNIGLILLVTIVGICLFDYADSKYFVDNQTTAAPSGELSIIVNTGNRTLELYADSKLHKRYRIAVGKTATPTPIGEWNIVYKSYSPKEIFGTRWMGLDIPWGSYGIHGTNMPWSIGYFASQGCIRMRNKDVEELYEWVQVGTPVKIQGPHGKIQRILRRHAVGTDVVVLQLKLIELGYFQEKANGCFGWETEAALRAFQRDKGLVETGVLDKRTLSVLGL